MTRPWWEGVAKEIQDTVDEETLSKGMDLVDLGLALPIHDDKARAKVDFLTDSARVFVEGANKIEIKDDDSYVNSYVRAGELLTYIKGFQDLSEKARDHFVRPLNNCVSEINGRFKSLYGVVKGEKVGSLGKAETRLKALVSMWQEKLEAESRERQREAEERARTDRAAVEQQRLEEADDLLAQGKTAEAEALLERPVEVGVTPDTTPEAPALASVSSRQKPMFKVLDIEALEPRYLLPDEQAIRKVVLALGEEAVKAVSKTPEKPAIEVWYERGIAAGKKFERRSVR